MKKIINLACIIAVLTFSACNKNITIGLLDNGTDRDQIEELCNVISAGDGMNADIISIDSECDLSKFDVIWYHRADSSDITGQETVLGDKVKNFVEKGGKLILSMDAVRLLNEWNIEETPISVFHYDAIDDGFGRKAGFHGFREHPIFKGMYGGSYVWHGHEDNTCRLLGFTQDATPAAAGAKVLGIFWEYIFYRPEEKVVWETPLGEGSILAIGGLLNYGKPNYNKALLDKFTTNCIEYISGKVNADTKEYCWDYSETPEIREDSFNYKEVSAAAPSKWAIGEDPHALVWETTKNEVNIATPKAVTVCKENGGIFEIWTHPFLSVRDFRVWVRKGDKIQLLSEEGARIELRSNAIIRDYNVEGGTVREIITASTNSSAVFAHYEWTDGCADEIITDFKSNLRYMWPYEEDALGSIYYGWDSSLNAFLTTDKNREFISTVGFNVPASLISAGRYDDYSYESGGVLVGKNTPLLQVAASVSLDINGKNSCDVIFVGGSEGDKKTVEEYSAAIANPFAAYTESRDYHENYFKGHTIIESPDPIFNEGYYWSLISCEQFRVDVPGMGKGTFAGYSSSRRGWGGNQRVSGRPGYAWFFGRDAGWVGLSFLDWGDFEIEKEVLKLLIKFQRIDGKIYHEATSNGSIHYDASDSTPFFVVLMARYLKATGDLQFVKDNIEAVHKALAYCKSTDTNGDGLLENTNVGHGWLEGGDFYGSRTELVIATLHCRALYEASWMCDLIGDKAHAKEYRTYGDEVKGIINNDFWNEKEQYYNFGKKDDGTFTEDLLALVSSCVYFEDTDYAKSQSTMKRFNDLHMRRDWGQKSVADTCTKLTYYGAYTEDNIWPLFTGTTALSEYRFGLYNQGFEHTMQTMLEYLGDSHGRVAEVLSGYSHKSCGITRNQCWSETMSIQPLIEGMLGFVPNSLNSSVKLAPRIPLMWNNLNVKNLRIGNKTLDMTMNKEDGTVTYKFEADGKLSVQMSPSFGIGTTVNSVTINGDETEFSIKDELEYSTVEFNLNLESTAEVVVSISERNAALPHYHFAVRDEEPCGAIIKTQRMEGDALVLEVQGYNGKPDTFAIYAPQGVSAVEGAEEFCMQEGGICNITVDFNGKDEKCITKTIIIHP